MAKISNSATVPVLFFDGKREADAGNIVFDASLGFEKLRSLIAQNIGTDPQQIALFFACSNRKKSRSPADSHRKIPINNDFDLAAAAASRRESNCFFFAVLKPRKERRRKPRRISDADDSPKMLLRRDPAPDFARIPPPETFPSVDRRRELGYLEYAYTIQELQRQKEAYFPMHTYTYADPYREHHTYGGVTVCEQCLESTERPVQFHSCVYDKITVGFRSLAGPIERPVKTKTRFMYREFENT